MSLQITGASIKESQRFEINLLAGESSIGPTSNVVLHISARYDEKKFVVNSATNGASISSTCGRPIEAAHLGEWAKEERKSLSLKPAQASISISLRMENWEWRIVNGESEDRLYLH